MMEKGSNMPVSIIPPVILSTVTGARAGAPDGEEGRVQHYSPALCPRRALKILA